MATLDADATLRAELYDRRMREMDRGDSELYAALARDAEGPALELACGTGRIYLDALAEGCDVDGFDRSAEMLAFLRERAAERGIEPSVWRADMTDFAVDREYELAYCPFNAVQHLLTIENQLDALRNVYDALAPGGRFVFDVFVPSFELIAETYGEWRTESVELREVPYKFRTRTRITDEVEQQFTVENELYDPDGSRVVAESHRLKMLPKREVELLARRSPFEEWTVRGGFETIEADATIEDGDSVQVWTLRKRA
ncbi:class I SAM-dependent DNA methyltransferase [Natronoarchaeum rubrum]|uniref:class I SAM-dependent DNA methyltransferase n=1 Tax=Natronoarchaeum rubrum TaxID=755311 RepID=UPI0021115549|nr:class I SAM-dependent methyltransferase [Natronoarchaeum rubrum]